MAMVVAGEATLNPAPFVDEGELVVGPDVTELEANPPVEMMLVVLARAELEVGTDGALLLGVVEGDLPGSELGVAIEEALLPPDRRLELVEGDLTGSELGVAVEEALLPLDRTVELGDGDLAGAELEVFAEDVLLLISVIVELMTDEEKSIDDVFEGVVVMEDDFVAEDVVVTEEDTPEQLPPGTLRTVIPGSSWSQSWPRFVLLRSSKLTPSLAAIP